MTVKPSKNAGGVAAATPQAGGNRDVFFDGNFYPFVYTQSFEEQVGGFVCQVGLIKGNLWER